jgi:alpha-beta hydrolase superfamily lysophospholipase
MSARVTALIPTILFWGGAATLVLFCIATWLESLTLTNPPGYGQPDPQGFVYSATPRTAAGLDFKDVELAVPNGEAVRGWLVPAPNDGKTIAIVALHGRADNRTAALGVLPVLHDLGAGVLAIDLRENGLSAGAGRGMALGIRESEDAIAAAAEMRRRGYNKVIVLGCSLGASTAILAAARDEAIDGVIAESPLSSFDRFVAEIADNRLSAFGVQARWATSIWGRAVIGVTRVRLGLRGFEKPIDAVERIAPRPLLLIAGGRDTVTPLAHARDLAERAGANASLWIAEEADHCGAAATAPDGYREHIAKLIESVRAAGR